MKQRIYFFTFLTVIFFSSLPLFALEPVILTDSPEEYPLGLHMEILEDKEKKWRIEDVTSPGFSKKFIKSNRENPNFGFTNSVYWARFKLKNISGMNEWLLEIGYPQLDRIELYIEQLSRLDKTYDRFVVKKAGDFYPFKEREVKHQNFVFHLPVVFNKEQIFYIRIETGSSMQIPLTLWSSEAFAENDHDERIAFGVYYGIILAMALYNLFLFFSLRDRNYLYYVLYIISYGFTQLSLNGIAYEYLWPDLPLWSNKSLAFLVGFLLLWLSKFSSNFLITRIHAPKTDKLFSMLVGLSLLVMLFSFTGAYQMAARVGVGLLLAFVLLAMTAGIITWLKGYRPARYFVIAWFIFLFGSFLYLLRAFGAAPNNFITTYSMQIGSTLEVVLLSLALADRINVMRREKEEAQALAIDNLHKADKLKDEFLANTSHELKTPLNGIIGIAEALIDGSAGKVTSAQSSRLTMILTSGKRLLNLVNDILDFSKLRHHDIALRKEPVDMRQITELVMILCRPMLAGKPLKLENEIGENLPLATGDENRLQQIMHNLIGNAIKFTESGTVRVTAKELYSEQREGVRENNYLEITVSDTGIGISKDKFDTIFKSFEQADAGISRLYGGTGLGLSITKQLIELHGGTIRVESELGKSSDFIFTLPVYGDREERIQEPPLRQIALTREAADAEISPVETARQIISTDGSTKILAVDDDPINLQVLVDQLFLQGYTVKQVTGGAEALDAVTKEQYDLVLLDIMMPMMSGYEVCKKLREKYSSNELPVIMLTAKDRVPDLIEGFDAGANDYLAKPISKGELLSRIKTHLESAFYYRELKHSNEKLDNLMKEFSRITAKIHNSLKNKLESIRNFLNHSIVLFDNKDKLMENLKKVRNLISHCSNESKNILFVVAHKECSLETFVKELELQAELALVRERIGYSLHKHNLPEQRILKPAIVQNLLDIYTELLNNIIKHSAANMIDIEINCENDTMSLIVKDDGVGFDYNKQINNRGTYGLRILEDLSNEIDASLLIDSQSGQGTTVKILVKI